jgi:hypothetical protein
MRMKRHAGVIRALVDETPDITFKECRTALAVRGVSAIRPVALALVAFGARPPTISVGGNYQQIGAPGQTRAKAGPYFPTETGPHPATPDKETIMNRVFAGLAALAAVVAVKALPLAGGYVGGYYLAHTFPHLIPMWIGATFSLTLISLGLTWTFRKLLGSPHLEWACGLTAALAITVFTITQSDPVLALLGYLPPAAMIYIVRRSRATKRTLATA